MSSNGKFGHSIGGTCIKEGLMVSLLWFGNVRSKGQFAHSSKISEARSSGEFACIVEWLPQKDRMVRFHERQCVVF